MEKIYVLCRWILLCNLKVFKNTFINLIKRWAKKMYFWNSIAWLFDILKTNCYIHTRLNWLGKKTDWEFKSTFENKTHLAHSYHFIYTTLILLHSFPPPLHISFTFWHWKFSLTVTINNFNIHLVQEYVYFWRLHIHLTLLKNVAWILKKLLLTKCL